MIKTEDERISLDQYPESHVLKQIDPSFSSYQCIGRGGTSIVYLAWNEKDGKNYIVKEYYPRIPKNLIGNLQYSRKNNGELLINCDNETKKQQEINRQEQRMQYELNVLKDIFSDETQFKNSNHVLPAASPYQLKRIGDTLYAITEFRAGNTLAGIVMDQKASSIKERFEDSIKITRQLLSLVEPLFSKRGWLHGDLKPENIWIGRDYGATDDLADNIYIIDYGSSFNYEKYREKIENANNDLAKMKEIAEEIKANESIGFSSVNYCSKALEELAEAKLQYQCVNYNINLRNLIEKMCKIDQASDLYSIVKIFYYMVTGGKWYNNNVDVLEESYEVSVVQKIKAIMQRNENGGYTTYEDVKYDLDILEAIYEKRAVPEVLIGAIINNDELKLKSFNERLLCSLEE